MALWEDFNVTFSFKRDFCYDVKTIDLLISSRRTLNNVLFFDRLLQIIGVEAASRAYPPRSNQALRNLYEQIIASGSPNHFKQSVIYYILRDCRSIGAGDGGTQFIQRSYLPEKYRLFIDGIWHLDRLEFKRALEYLTEPSLIPTFPDEILYVLATVPKQDDSLALAYFLTASPPLASPEVLEAYFATLCRTSVTESFYFSRQRDAKTRQTLLEQLVVSVLETDPGERRAKRAMELISLPLDEQEEAWFEECLLRGKAKNLQGAKDTAMMRRVATGRVDNLGNELEALGGRRIEGVNWDDLKQNLRQSTSLV
ncbi:hypothetical protein VTO42DRAFT_4372 [Malbranchea cinnamomea]